MRIGELFGRLSEDLGSRREATILLEEAAGRPLADLVARFREDAPATLVEEAEALARRRGAGLPLQHVVGHWGFRRLELLQDGRALVVRPETEFVVEVALAELGRRDAPVALDLGTGSGAIALALANERQELEVLALDVALDALSLAAANRARRPEAERTRVHLLASDWYGAVVATRRFDLIVSNPPYVTEEEWSHLDPVVREHDPKRALVSGPSGLEAIAAVLAGAAARLRSGGAVVCEIGAAQRAQVLDLAAAAGAVAVRVLEDLAGRDRVLVAGY